MPLNHHQKDQSPLQNDRKLRDTWMQDKLWKQNKNSSQNEIRDPCISFPKRFRKIKCIKKRPPFSKTSMWPDFPAARLLCGKTSMRRNFHAASRPPFGETFMRRNFHAALLSCCETTMRRHFHQGCGVGVGVVGPFWWRGVRVGSRILKFTGVGVGVGVVIFPSDSAALISMQRDFHAARLSSGEASIR